MKFSLLTLSILVAISFLSGCTHVENNQLQPDIVVPEKWKNATNFTLQNNDIMLQKWQGDDPILAKLQTLLLNNNNDLQVAALNYARSRVSRKVAESQDQPQIGLGGAISRQRLSEDGATTRIIDISSSGEQREALIDALTSPYTVFSTGFDASWEPDLWGKVANKIRAAKAYEEVTINEYKSLNLLLQTELMRLYTELRTQQYRLQTLSTMLNNVKVQKELVDTLYHEGLTTRIQSIELAKQANLLEKQINVSENLVYLTANQLTLLVGEQPGKLNSILFDHDNVQLHVFSPLPLRLPSDVLRQRPDVKVAEAQLKASTAAIGIAQADLYPQFTLTGNISIEALSSNALSDWSSRSWQIGPRFYLPIFNRGQLKRQVELTKLEQQQAAIQYKQKILSAWTEVDSAINQITASATQLSQSNHDLALQQEQLDLIGTQVQEGLDNELPWYNQQNQVLNSRLEVAQATFNYNISQLALYKATGGLPNQDIALDITP